MVARKLHGSIDGLGLAKSGGVPQQHQWVIDGTRFLSGRDFLNIIKLRINALPTRSKCARGRMGHDKRCRAGCSAVETMNHIQQICERTHDTRVDRHDDLVKYVARGASRRGFAVLKEPAIRTNDRLRKPDLIISRAEDEVAYVVDAQIIGEQQNLPTAHERKKNYYRQYLQYIRALTGIDNIHFGSITLNWRKIWSESSVNQLISWKIIQRSDLKIISTRALIGGLISFRHFNRATSMVNHRISVR